jgi:NADPH-dependent 2,4-dienoyl-CoA reductase/sulfur reductase-like enzyme/rhodanese-related sulfurtransferase
MKTVIIGGVAGGASAAARLRRVDESADILLLQSGPDVSFASCGMPYFIGGEITDRASMSVQTPQSLNARLNIDVRVNIRVIEINTEAKTVTAKNELSGEPLVASYDHLVLAVGAEPFRPPIPGIDRQGLFALRNLEDMDAIVAWIQKKQEENPHDEPLHCVVAGAGFVGLEMVEQLARRKMNVTMVERLPQIMAPLDIEMAAILHKDLESRGVNVIVGDGIAEFQGCNDGDPDSTVVVLSSGRALPPAQITILGLGVRPDTQIVKDAGIECTRSGHVLVDGQLRTSVPNVWAVGDAIIVKNPIIPNNTWAVPLAGPANRQGRMVADNINGKGRTYKGTFGASVVRVFDLVAACVGMNEKMVEAMHLPFASIHVHPGSHAGYFPGAKSINFKLVFNPEDGAIYGAQAIGEDGVEKRIDVISTAMQGKLSVMDLAELELCYAPPVGSAKDPVNMAGMAAQNIVEGLVTQIDWKDLDDIAKDPDTVVLDVRNPGEISKMGVLIEGALNIPLDSLRSRMHELPKDKRIVVSCASGQRAYYACRILRQSNFERVDNLSGAFKTYSSVK